MKFKPVPWSSFVALLVLGSESSWAQDAAQLDAVVVRGTRQSVETAQARKRDAAGVLDAVVAEDVQRLPDLSVADALQRITGVQVARSLGEGSGVSVRGLLQVETTLNGREVFTAGTGRTLDFADLAAETVAGIDVHKSAAADRIEGGLGGLIDVRTYRPFDFRGDAAQITARAVHGDLSGGTAGQASGLVVRRWRVGEGELAALVNLVFQERRWREDQKGSGTPTSVAARVPGLDVFAPNGSSETTSIGRRRRSGGSAVIEWRPTPAWAVYGEAHAAELLTHQDSNQINVGLGTGVVPGSVETFPGSTDVRHITWTNAPVSILDFARDTLDRSAQAALGARWRGERLEIDADASHTRSRNHLYFAGPFFATTAAQFTQDLSGSVPATAVSGTNLADPAGIRYTGYAYRTRPFEGSLDALRLDGRWQLDVGPLEQLAFGWRRALRSADNQPGLIFADATISGLTAADTPGRVSVNPVTDFLGGATTSVSGYLIGSLADARDAAAARAALGITTALPTAAAATSQWRIRERSDALYAQADAGWPRLQLNGQAGLRVVQTERVTDSAQTVSGSGAFEPITLRDTSTDWLPSASLRWRPTPELQARAAVSRTLTRPDFVQLSPALILTPNPINPELNQGQAGNPALRPIRSNNIDLALEHQAGRGQAASLTLFWKRVDGFLATLSQPEEHGGQVYQVSRPRNADKGRVHGAELSWHRFFDGLPGAWRGLGVQANYTYVESSTFDRVLQRQLPFQNLSRHSANLVGLYELGPWAARLAWNWRSRYYSGSTSVVGLGQIDAWTHEHGWLDASLRWRITDRLTWSLDGVNLTRTLRRSDYGAASRPQNAFMNDRQLATSLAVQF